MSATLNHDSGHVPPKAQPGQNPPPDSYYGMSVINPPIWEEREIAGYLFLGGLSGASAILAAGAQLSGRPRLAARCELCASGAIAVSLLALVKDLGRPTRFLNMLRVFKPTSPMSVGTWILSTYSPLIFAATGSRLSGRLVPLGRVAGLGAALTGSLVSTYTAALIADTAVPAWHDGHRELPFLFAGSSAMAAGGLGLLAAPRVENSPAWRMAMVGGVVELVTERLLERRLGIVADTVLSGAGGERLKLAKRLATGGLAVAGLWGRRHRAAAATGGAALVAASAFTRFGIFAAGMDSARDPRYTVEPQRARLAQRQSEASS